MPIAYAGPNGDRRYPQRTGPREFLGETDVLLAIYADAMDADPALLPGRRELMRRHAGYPTFRALLATATGCSGDGQVLGFTYGFRGQPGQWWYDAVRCALTAADRPGADRCTG